MKQISTSPTNRINEIKHFILNLDPRLELRFSYGVPFIYCKKPLAYICAQKGVLVIGFAKGAAMDQSHGWWSATDRKVIRHLIIPDQEEIPYHKITSLVEEAIEINLKKV